MQIALILMAYTIKLTLHWFCSAANEFADLSSRVHHPVSGARHRRDLDALVATWRAEHTPWTFRHLDQSMSERELRDEQAAKAILTEWRALAAQC